MQEISKDSFKEKVIINVKPVILEFYGDNCPSCKKLQPVIEKLSNEIKDINFFKIKLERNREIFQEYGIMSIPTLIFFADGKNKDELIGNRSEESIRSWINKNL